MTENVPNLDPFLDIGNGNPDNPRVSPDGWHPPVPVQRVPEGSQPGLRRTV